MGQSRMERKENRGRAVFRASWEWMKIDYRLQSEIPLQPLLPTLESRTIEESLAMRSPPSKNDESFNQKIPRRSDISGTREQLFCFPVQSVIYDTQQARAGTIASFLNLSTASRSPP